MSALDPQEQTQSLILYRQEIEWAPYQSAEALNQNKFLLDIDGNGWSARFRR